MQNQWVQSEHEYNQLTQQEKKSIADIFHLTEIEYQRYLDYMHHSYDGLAYDQKTNPNIILAMHAKNRASYERYLENAVRLDHDATEAMVKVSRDYTKMAKALYPQERPIVTPKMKANISHWIKAGDTFQLYCKLDKSQCAQLVSLLLPAVVSVTGAHLDIFGIDVISADSLIDFAKSIPIVPELVNTGVVTLNRYEGDSDSNMPTLLLKRDARLMNVTFMKEATNG